MARPSVTEDTIVIEIDGELLTWTEGKLTGTNEDYVEKAKYLSRYNIEVDLTPFGPTIKADLEDKDSPEQAVAAMVGAVPGRGRIIEAPARIFDLLPFEDEDNSGVNEGETSSYRSKVIIPDSLKDYDDSAEYEEEPSEK